MSNKYQVSAFNQILFTLTTDYTNLIGQSFFKERYDLLELAKNSVRYLWLSPRKSSQMEFFKFETASVFTLFLYFFSAGFIAVPLRTTGQIIDKEISQYTYGGSGPISEIKPAKLNPNALHIYSEPEWQTGKINFYGNETLVNIPLRYDIIRNRLVLLIEEELKTLHGRHIRSFEWFLSAQNRKVLYLNCKELMFKDEELTGFLEVLVEGKNSLYCHKVIKIFQGNSSTSLTGSHRKDDIYLVDKYYTMQEGFIVPLPKKRKELLNYFGDHRADIKDFINKNGLLMKRKTDLIRIFEYYNQIDN